MDYSEDLCMNNFTPEQRSLMVDNWYLYRIVTPPPGKPPKNMMNPVRKPTQLSVRPIPAPVTMMMFAPKPPTPAPMMTMMLTKLTATSLKTTVMRPKSILDRPPTMPPSENQTPSPMKPSTIRPTLQPTSKPTATPVQAPTSSPDNVTPVKTTATESPSERSLAPAPPLMDLPIESPIQPASRPPEASP
jgi:hypothetical protein